MVLEQGGGTSAPNASSPLRSGVNMGAANRAAMQANSASNPLSLSKIVGDRQNTTTDRKELAKYDTECPSRCGTACLVYQGELVASGQDTATGTNKSSFSLLGKSSKSDMERATSTSLLQANISGYRCPGLMYAKSFYPAHRVVIGRQPATGRGQLMTKTNVVLYDGDWLDGYRHGRGVGLILREEKTDTAKGKGVVYTTEGEYSGDWSYGLRQGRGTFIWSNDDRYDGEWRHDQPEGRGTLTYVNGGQFRGQWYQGKRHGCGRFLWPNGKVEDRLYHHGQLQSTSPLSAIEMNDLVEETDSVNATLIAQKKEIEHDMETKWRDLRSDADSNELRVKMIGDELAKSVEHEKMKSLCRICGTNKRNTVITPCQHLLYCADCIHKHQQTNHTCPECGTPIQGLLECKTTVAVV